MGAVCKTVHYVLMLQQFGKTLPFLELLIPLPLDDLGTVTAHQVSILLEHNNFRSGQGSRMNCASTLNTFALKTRV